MAEAVKMLLDKHPTDKGVIHTTNYKVAKYLMENVLTNRFLSHDSSNRDEVLKKHVECPEPTVLISPSMMEGVDLADDASRFQILCKTPFPYLGDLVIKKRMERNKMWYPYMTAKSVIQAFGRSIRNEKDHAISYILDSDWDRFYSRNIHMFPEEFRLSFTP
jgi:Rad3-related DNA helicase